MRKFYADQIISVVVGYLIDYYPSVFLTHKSFLRRIDNQDVVHRTSKTKIPLL